VIHALLVIALFSAAPKAPAKTKPSTPAVAAPAQPVDAGNITPPPLPPSLEQVGEVKEIELDERRARAVYKIRTAISIPAVVEFPEAFIAAPACGDCADALKPSNSAALFALQAEQGGTYLIVKPRMYPGQQADGSFIPASDFVTSITVRLQSFTLTLQIELTENKSQADQRVRFVVPSRATETRFVSESIAKAKASLEAEFANRVDAAAADQMLRNILEPHECRANSARQRLQDVVLEVRELCRFGKRLYVRFSLENRGRALFVIDSVAVGVGDNNAFTAVEGHSITTASELAFGALTEGVLGFDAEDPTAHNFELRITEKGGRTRVIAAQNFGF